MHNIFVSEYIMLRTAAQNFMKFDHKKLHQNLPSHSKSAYISTRITDTSNMHVYMFICTCVQCN
jgi:hypothetical protein